MTTIFDDLRKRYGAASAEQKLIVLRHELLRPIVTVESSAIDGETGGTALLAASAIAVAASCFFFPCSVPLEGLDAYSFQPQDCRGGFYQKMMLAKKIGRSLVHSGRR